MALTITSNYRTRRLLSFNELPLSERADFDYMHADCDVECSCLDEARFVLAYGSWHDTYEFESIARGISVPVVAPSRRDKGSLVRWDAIQSGSAWHALVLRYFDADGYELDGVVVGWAQW